MLTITPSASQHLHEINSKSPDGTTVRLIPNDQGYTMAFDQPREGDAVVEHDSQPVLVMEPAVAAQLDNRTIDVVQTAEGQGLRIT